MGNGVNKPTESIASAPKPTPNFASEKVAESNEVTLKKFEKRDTQAAGQDRPQGPGHLCHTVHAGYEHLHFRFVFIKCVDCQERALDSHLRVNLISLDVADFQHRIFDVSDVGLEFLPPVCGIFFPGDQPVNRTSMWARMPWCATCVHLDTKHFHGNSATDEANKAGDPGEHPALDQFADRRGLFESAQPGF
jgi:hypothetical protein